MTPRIGRSAGFAVTTEFVGSRVVVGVRGPVDLFTASDLGALLNALIDREHQRIALDLGECDSMDVSGLQVVAGTVGRLQLEGGHRLAIRWPSPEIRLVLELTGLADLADIEPPGPLGDRIGPQQAVAGPSVPAGPPKLGERLRRVSAVPASGEVVDSALRLVVTMARATVAGADGVSVTLRRGGRLSTVAGSDQTILDMDADQYATGEGPCVDASVEGHWFHAAFLATETRWPAFTPQALALGIRSILSSPLLVRDGPVGALNIYSRTPAAFSADDQRLASVFATEASAVLTAAGADVTSDQFAARVARALQSRQVIALAQGVLMERHHVNESAAFTVLRRSSVETGNPLHQRAAETIASTRRPQSEPPARPGNNDE